MVTLWSEGIEEMWWLYLTSIHCIYVGRYCDKDIVRSYYLMLDKNWGLDKRCK